MDKAGQKAEDLKNEMQKAFDEVQKSKGKIAKMTSLIINWHLLKLIDLTEKGTFSMEVTQF